MYLRYQVRSIAAFMILLCITASQALSQEVPSGTQWGLGLSSQYDIPLYTFYDRFDGGANIGLKVSFVKNTTTYDITYFTSNFSNGKIEKTKFQWVFDGNYYSSPKASSDISFHGLTATLQKPFHFNIGPLSPFWSVGSGFIYYKHEIRNLVFPGQSVPPLDQNFIYSPDDETRTSFSINFGGGLAYNPAPQLKLALNLRYNIIFGYLRPMEAWFLEKVTPMQLFGIGLDLTYYFNK